MLLRAHSVSDAVEGDQADLVEYIEIVEMAFVGRCDYVMMIYVEKRLRSLQE